MTGGDETGRNEFLGDDAEHRGHQRPPVGSCRRVSLGSFSQSSELFDGFSGFGVKLALYHLPAWEREDLCLNPGPDPRRPETSHPVGIPRSKTQISRRASRFVFWTCLFVPLGCRATPKFHTSTNHSESVFFPFSDRVPPTQTHQTGKKC